MLNLIFVTDQALRSELGLGGCIALSSWLPFRSEYPASITPGASNIKVFQVHGTADSVVSYRWGHGSHELLKTFIKSTPPRLMTIEGMGHSSDPSELEAVSSFLKTVFNIV